MTPTVQSSCEELRKSFGRKVILKGISFSLERGVYGLLGPNGSGKTTLMRCLTGVLKADAGSISVPERIGYLPQQFGMYKELRVQEAMEYYAALKKIPRAEQKTGIEECLAAVNLADAAGKKIGALSGGMLRRMGIAQALLGDPQLLIVDEPTAGLDPEERMRFKQLIFGMKKQRTVLISTHIVEDVEAICDRIIILKEGEILKSGTASEIAEAAAGYVSEIEEAEQTQFRGKPFLLRTEEKDGRKLLRVLSRETGIGEPQPPTLEDGYMKLLHPEV